MHASFPLRSPQQHHFFFSFPCLVSVPEFELRVVLEYEPYCWSQIFCLVLWAKAFSLSIADIIHSLCSLYSFGFAGMASLNCLWKSSWDLRYWRVPVLQDYSGCLVVVEWSIRGSVISNYTLCCFYRNLCFAAWLKLRYRGWVMLDIPCI